MKRGFMDRIIDTIEAIAALFVGLVAADIFISVILRRFFSTQIPDAYDFGSMLLGMLIGSRSRNVPSLPMSEPVFPVYQIIPFLSSTRPCGPE